MRRLPVCLALVLAVPSGAALRAATDVNLNVPIFSRSMSNSDLWDDFDPQAGAGAGVDLGRHGAPIHFAVGTLTSVSTKSFSDPLAEDTRAAISEIYFGVAKVWETKGSARPFVGGGASFVRAEMERNVILGSGIDREDDDSIGFYIEGGIYWRLTSHFNFGLAGRTLVGTSITLFGVDGDADYWQFGPMLGWSWPGKTN